ncbi:MFS transporter [Agaricicola taiwanensis]|uniref:MFS transporter n=1 Tax=Agaricicola taiwanensis TaxID=591372 RepID=A0A8J2YBJ2_9RHOB|nr:MFS transporter [Agaricicola taiwanensis]GGE33440.1 MFS transporter [Agaricicola taiwanensis]
MSEISAAALPYRDGRVISLIGGAHFSSHFFHLVLPPLFPILRTEFGVGYVELGFIMSVFFTTSGFGQVAAGFVVDRFGPHRVLCIGIALLGLSMVIAGLAPSYWFFLPVAVIAGLGNSVFHPADYSILTARVTPSRMARAYSVHNIGGSLGWAAAPVVVLALSGAFGWRTALIIIGLAGLVFAALILSERNYLHVQNSHAAPTSAGAPAIALLSRPILICFAYFAMVALAMSGVQSFLPTLLPKVQYVSLTLAALATTLYLVGSAVGALGGGILADKTPNHDRIIAVGLFFAGFMLLAIGYLPLPVPLVFLFVILAGFAVGSTSPSRDMMVRAATPPGSTGKVFGFVYSGLDLGSTLAPLVIGGILDHGEPSSAFAFVAVALLGAVAVAFGIKTQVRKS